MGAVDYELHGKLPDLKEFSLSSNVVFLGIYALELFLRVRLKLL